MNKTNSQYNKNKNKKNSQYNKNKTCAACMAHSLKSLVQFTLQREIRDPIFASETVPFCIWYATVSRKD